MPLTAVVPSATLTLTPTVSIAAVVPTAALDLPPPFQAPRGPGSRSCLRIRRGDDVGARAGGSALEPSAVAILEPTAAAILSLVRLVVRLGLVARLELLQAGENFLRLLTEEPRACNAA